MAKYSLAERLDAFESAQKIVDSISEKMTEKSQDPVSTTPPKPVPYTYNGVRVADQGLSSRVNTIVSLAEWLLNGKPESKIYQVVSNTPQEL